MIQPDMFLDEPANLPKSFRDGRGRRDTSIAAYRDVPLQARETEVMRYILARPEVRDWTRAELAHAMGWRDGPVCGRVNALIAKGRLIEGARRACAMSGKQAHAVRAS